MKKGEKRQRNSRKGKDFQTGRHIKGAGRLLENGAKLNMTKTRTRHAENPAGMCARSDIWELRRVREAVFRMGVRTRGQMYDKDGGGGASGRSGARAVVLKGKFNKV